MEGYKGFNLYQVGGCVRDYLLNYEPKDIDYAAVFDANEDASRALKMLNLWMSTHGRVYRVSPKNYTIRGLIKGVPTDVTIAHVGGKTCSLLTDLDRRDFIINAFALDENNKIVGRTMYKQNLDQHLKELEPQHGIETYIQDPVRILRAIRFLNKYSLVDKALFKEITEFSAEGIKLQAAWDEVPTERLRQELERCFQQDTLGTIHHLNRLGWIKDELFRGRKLNLRPYLSNG